MYKESKFIFILFKKFSQFRGEKKRRVEFGLWHWNLVHQIAIRLLHAMMHTDLMNIYHEIPLPLLGILRIWAVSFLMTLKDDPQTGSPCCSLSIPEALQNRTWHPSDPTQNWYHRPCIPCNRICILNPTVDVIAYLYKHLMLLRIHGIKDNLGLSARTLVITSH